MFIHLISLIVYEFETGLSLNNENSSRDSRKST